MKKNKSFGSGDRLHEQHEKESLSLFRLDIQRGKKALASGDCSEALNLYTFAVADFHKRKSNKDHAARYGKKTSGSVKALVNFKNLFRSKCVKETIGKGGWRK